MQLSNINDRFTPLKYLPAVSHWWPRLHNTLETVCPNGTQLLLIQPLLWLLWRVEMYAMKKKGSWRQKCCCSRVLFYEWGSEKFSHIIPGFKTNKQTKKTVGLKLFYLPLTSWQQSIFINTLDSALSCQKPENEELCAPHMSVASVHLCPEMISAQPLL